MQRHGLRSSGRVSHFQSISYLIAIKRHLRDGLVYTPLYCFPPPPLAFLHSPYHSYVCITPHTSAAQDLVLTYPSADPTTWGEYYGLVAGKGDSRPVRVNPGYDISGAATAPASSGAASAARGSAGANTGSTSSGAARSSSSGGASRGVGETLGASTVIRSAVGLTGRESNAVPSSSSSSYFSAPSDTNSIISADDQQPLGRSFWNHRFVHQLRLAALGEPNCATHVGTVRRLVYKSDLSADPSLVKLRAGSGEEGGPPRFAGFDRDEKAIPYAGQKADASTAASTTGSSGGGSSGKTGGGGNDDEVAGVVWRDESGAERVTLARLTVRRRAY